MRRIYFLSPDIETTKRIVDDLLLGRIEERHIHVVAKRGTAVRGIRLVPVDMKHAAT